jgi:hypothetical protein
MDPEDRMAGGGLDLCDSTGMRGENLTEFGVAWNVVNFWTNWLSASEGLEELRFTDRPKMCERLPVSRVVMQYVTWQRLVTIGVDKRRRD